MLDVTLLPFARSQFSQWHVLWREYQAFYRVDIAEEISHLTWHRLLDPTEPMHGTFAMLGNRPIGFVHYVEHRSCWTRGNYVYLQDLLVTNEFRGQGVGRELIEDVYAFASRRECARVYWLTHESNHDAMQLYDRVADRPGFIQYRKVFGT